MDVSYCLNTIRSAHLERTFPPNPNVSASLRCRRSERLGKCGELGGDENQIRHRSITGGAEVSRGTQKKEKGPIAPVSDILGKDRDPHCDPAIISMSARVRSRVSNFQISKSTRKFSAAEPLFGPRWTCRWMRGSCETTHTVHLRPKSATGGVRYWVFGFPPAPLCRARSRIGVGKVAISRLAIPNLRGISSRRGLTLDYAMVAGGKFLYTGCAGNISRMRNFRDAHLRRKSVDGVVDIWHSNFCEFPGPPPPHTHTHRD